LRLLDTDVCIEILRGNEDVIERRRRHSDTVAITWITAAELLYGAARSKAPDENRTLALQFLTTLDILGLDVAAAETFGRLMASLEAAGMRLADFNLLIASIALSRRAVLVSGNRRHYDRVPGLESEDWIRG
jgi:tRNA(fMet)-specific endonuclease VapC